MRRGKVPTQRVDSAAALPVGEKQRIEALVNSGHLDKARKLAERLCRKYRESPEAWFLLGAVSGSQGDYRRAVECCRSTTRLAPRVAIGHYNLAVALNNTGRPKEAAVSLEKALELQPVMPEALRELGNVYTVLGQYELALGAISRLTMNRPDNVFAWIAQGNLYEKLSNPAEAECSYRKALEVEAQSVAARINLGNVLRAQEKNGEAEECYRALLDEDPSNVDAIYNLAVLYQSCYRYPDAEARYLEVLELNPEHTRSLNNLGLVLAEQVRLDEAEELFIGLLEKQPDEFDTKLNLARVFREQNRLDLAEEQLTGILSRDPENTPARKDRSLVWLQQGRFDKGWDEFEWRNAGIDIAERWPFARWDGTELRDATVLVYPEQGIGDEVMFSSCIMDMARTAGRVVLACDYRLEELFKRSFPVVSVVGRGHDQGVEWLEQLPHVDAQVAIASLPKYFRRHLEDFAGKDQGYLLADQETMEKWRSRYRALGDGLKVGLSWHGGHISNTRKKRSIPLDQWGDVFGVSDVHFVNLQYGECREAIDVAQRTHDVEVHDWDDSNPLVDIDDFAAKLRALDLVVSIDNSTVHLAGALGVETWLLQPFSPDWRWQPDQDGSYWYRSVRQFRQTSPGEWGCALARVAAELSRLVNEARD